MKKIIISLFGVFIALGAICQPTFVSTMPSNKNVVIEEYTGTNCTWCPAGHKIVHDISVANPGKIVAINIHQGGFSGNNPDYKTEWGDALASQYSISSYPNGTLNRGTGSVSYTTWPTAVTPILSQSSIVNVAAQAQIDAATRQLTVTVEAYYTGDADASSNMLNVALLQNNVLGPQVGMDKNPEQIVNGKYRHMHMLRHLITGQWGDSLKVESGVITSGTFFTRTYTYALPESIREVPLVLGDLEIAVYIAKNHKTIYTGSTCIPTYIQPNFGASILNYNMEDMPCSRYIGQKMSVQNIGLDTITSMVFDTKVFGLSQTTNWEGSIAPFETIEITNLPVLDLQNGMENDIEAMIISVNGQSYQSVKKATFFKPAAGQNGLTLNLTLDRYGSETTWTLKNSSGVTIKSGGPYTDGTTGRLQVVDLGVTENDCYTFKINDSYGDGINTGYLVGGYTIVDGNGALMAQSEGKFTTSESKGIGYGEYIGLEDVTENNISLNVYPNPVKDIATLDIILNSNSIATIQVIDMLGKNIIDLGNKSIKAGQNSIELKTSNLNSGMYFVKVCTDKGTITKKITVSK